MPLESAQCHEMCSQSDGKTHSSNPTVHGDIASGTDNTSPTSALEESQSGGGEQKHSCWICQEELSNEGLLLEHYENHMRCV